MRTTWAGLGIGIAALIAGALHAAPLHAQTSDRIAALSGQTATLLPDGRWLVLGGQASAGPTRAAMIIDVRSAGVEPLIPGLEAARAGHSATLLPDGTVMILGGIGIDGRLVDVVETFDPTTNALRIASSTGPSPRAGHTATVLTDGRALIVGGVGPDGAGEGTAERWDPRSGTAESVLADAALLRTGHTATLLADGSVLISAGVDGSGRPGAPDLRYDPSANRMTALTAPSTFEDSGMPPEVAETRPPMHATGVAVESQLAVRFSTPARVESVNPQTVTLNGPRGLEAVTATPVEGGMLVFVSPQGALAAGATYDLALNGVVDAQGRMVPFTAIRFTTQASPATVASAATATTGAEANSAARPGERLEGAAMDEDDPWQWRGERRNGKPYSRWQALAPLQALPGVTALAGQVLRLNGQPLAGVTVRLARGAGQGIAEARSDDTGRFLVLDPKVGRQELLIDGRSASQGDRTYGVFEVGVDLAPGTTTALDYTIWMPRIDTANAVAIPTYTTSEIAVTTPRILGLELKIPAHSGIRDHESRPATQISITPIPQDRPPFPLPRGIEAPAFFTVQPGAGYVYSGSGQGARITYPNTQREVAGTRFNFWHYDPAAGWHVYGLGTVTADARQIVPDPKVEIYEFTGAMSANPGLAGPAEGAPGRNVADSDPVYLSTGTFVMTRTDLVLPDVIPIVLTRAYRSSDTQSRAFGRGSTHPYDIFLVGSISPWTFMDLVLLDGQRIHFARTSPGTGWEDAVFEHTESPTRFFKARISWNQSRGGWDLKLKDGTVLEFPEASSAQTSMQAAVTGIKDRLGNSLALVRDANRNLTSLTTASGRTVELTVDASNRITQAKDNIGRIVTYAYDGAGRLGTVTDAAGGTTTYTYDASNRMATITDPRGITYLTNEYDATGKVIRQTQPGGIVHRFAYTVGPGGAITQAEVTNPRGFVRRVTFDVTRSPLADMRAVGTAEQQTTTYEWQAGTNLLSARTDTLGRRTAFGYDAMGNMTSVTELAGTAEAVTTAFTYEPQFNQVATVSDPLGHVTVYGYDALGNRTTAVDPLGQQTAISYTSAGLPRTITTAAGATQLTYADGDLVAVTDALGRTTTRFTDAAGRLVAVTDPRGNRTWYEYDALNRLVKIIDPLGGATTFGYDGNGNLLSVRDPRNSTTSYNYDALDRVGTRSDPMNRMESYQYDSRGNLAQRTDRLGKVTVFGYDALDRRTFAGFGQAAPSTYESTITYAYDGGNRLRAIVDSLGGPLTLSHDALDRVTQEVSPQGTISYAFDAAGRRTRMTVLGEPDVTYHWDGADRLLRIVKGTATAAFNYDGANRRTQLALPNEVTLDYGWDAASQLTGLTYRKGAATLGALTYGYDAAGNRTQMGGTWARSGLPEPIVSATYDAANRQLSLGARSMTYDLAGNMLTLAESSGTTSFTWNARGELAGLASADATATFQYDGLGRRRAKTVNGTQTMFLYDGLNPIQESSGGTVQAMLLSGRGLDEWFTRSTSTGTRTLLADGLGSIVAVLDDSGMLQSEYTYEPFGATTTAGADGMAQQYTGRENDGTGLYFYRRRYYHPSLQRFVSEDPIGFAGGDVNLYVYVGNAPVDQVDPLGTTKGGWQSIFGGSDDPLLRDVNKQMTKDELRARAKIIEEAIDNEAMSTARKKTLRGAAKVLKRFLRFGGAIAFALSELADPAEAGGGPGDTMDTAPPLGCRKC